MTAYFVRRFLLVIPTFIGITVLVFVVTRFVPGGPIERIIAQAQQQAMEGGGRVASATVQQQPLLEEQIKQLGGDVASSANPPSGCRFHTRCPAGCETLCRIPAEFNLLEAEK